MCHLDYKRECDGSCIAFDNHIGCRLKSNGYSPAKRSKYDWEDDFGLKEI